MMLNKFKWMFLHLQSSFVPIRELNARKNLVCYNASTKILNHSLSTTSNEGITYLLLKHYNEADLMNYSYYYVYDDDLNFKMKKNSVGFKNYGEAVAVQNPNPNQKVHS